MKTVLLGSGNVATHLANAWAGTQELLGIWSHTPEHARVLAKETRTAVFTYLNEIPTDADLYLIAVRDDAVPSVANALPAVNGIVAHTSGSQPLHALSEKHAQRGVFYPLQSFSKHEPLDLKTVPFCIEGSDAATQDNLVAWARALSDRVQIVSSEQRQRLHLAAVFANNFVNHLWAISARLLQEHDLPFEVLHPLVKETLRKALATSPEEAQTGPARRGDLKTLQKHLDLLAEHGQESEIYTLVSQSIERFYTHG